VDTATAAAREEKAVKIRVRSRAVKGLLFGTAMLTAVAPLSPALASSAGSYTPIFGSGSSWASVALTQWAQNLHANGITIQFNPDGSAAGRDDYMSDTDDFAASDPPFRNGTDPFDLSGAEHPPFGYSYVPDTAGGTAFMYHLNVGGRLITNLRLSGETLAKIFTGVITNWDDPEITHDYGAQLPNIPIIPVVRSDGSGATYFFTRWMSHMYPSIWNAFCAKVSNNRVGTAGHPCTQTEFYPGGWGASVSQNGSNNVASYVTASYGEGAIGYDEYAYALNSHYPVVSLLNPAGYYVQPSASNVAVALTQAVINEDQSSPDFLQQDLDSVYTFTDPRSYPLSSYSYLIVPRVGAAVPPVFSKGAGATLSTYINYFLCAGQQYSAELGYSPLPLNLVEGGLIQSGKIPGGVPAPSMANCDNPTLQNGQLIVLKDAPYPNKCEKATAPLDCNPAAPAAGAHPSSSASASTGTGTSTTSGTGTGSTTTAQGPVTGQVVNLAASDNNPTMFGLLTAVELLVVVVAPPAIYMVLRRRRQARR
jgi:ABC-type phosphate transport system substrate-binding protein